VLLSLPSPLSAAQQLFLNMVHLPLTAIALFFSASDRNIRNISTGIYTYFVPDMNDLARDNLTRLGTRSADEAEIPVLKNQLYRKLNYQQASPFS
jgi:hypothetical protein